MALAAAMFITMGPAEQAKTLLTEALETADALNDLNAQAGALSTLISIYTPRGEYGRAQIAAERIEQIAYRIGDPTHLRLAYQHMGTALHLIGRPREAQQYLETRSSISRRAGRSPGHDLLQFECPCGGPGDVGSGALDAGFHGTGDQ